MSDVLDKPTCKVCGSPLVHRHHAKVYWDKHKYTYCCGKCWYTFGVYHTKQPVKMVLQFATWG